MSTGERSQPSTPAIVGVDLGPRKRLPVAAIGVTVAVLLAAFIGRFAPVVTGSVAYTSVLLGVTTVPAAFLLVELVARVVPALQPLRSTIVGRDRLTNASIVVTILSGFAMATALVRVTRMASPELFDADPRVVVLVASATVALSCLGARLIDKRGIGNGFSLLIGLGALGQVFQMVVVTGQAVTAGQVTPAAAAGAFAVCLAVVGSTVVFGGIDERNPASPPRPVGGFIGAVAARIITTNVSLLLAGLAPLLGSELASRMSDPAPLFEIVVAAIAGALATALFARRRLSVSVLLTGAAFAAALRTPTALFQQGGIALDVLSLVVVSAVAKDVVVELRARADGPVVRVASLGSVADAGAVLALLGNAGVVGFVRGLHHRALWQSLAPFIPVDVYVPADQAEAAQKTLHPA